jgi:hypothetical protein
VLLCSRALGEGGGIPLSDEVQEIDGHRVEAIVTERSTSWGQR